MNAFFRILHRLVFHWTVVGPAICATEGLEMNYHFEQNCGTWFDVNLPRGSAGMGQRLMEACLFFQSIETLGKTSTSTISSAAQESPL